jgi:hypothetical protein
MNTVSVTNIWQLVAVLLGSGALTTLVYGLRSLGLPNAWVPPITHVIAVLVLVLIIVANYLAHGVFTWTGLIAAILTGLIGAEAAAGLHSNVTNYGATSTPVPPVPVFPKAGYPATTTHVSHKAKPVPVPPETIPPTATA